MKQSGIYQIRNSITNKLYIGYSKNLMNRWNQHLHKLRNGCHNNPHLQSSYNTHGINSFEFIILELCDISMLATREHHYTQLLDTHNPEKGYNIYPTDDSIVKEFSQETRHRMSIAQKARQSNKYIPPKETSIRHTKYNSRKVIDLSTNITYPTVSLAAQAACLSKPLMYMKLKGIRPNNTTFKYVE